ncbi:MAG TPA: efflux RND transporter periplasmic adaptor subunit [Bryobacteraceae bacterium]|nr:efflux RND transporter periplasmic adaptor subunit [Bryobacteraceae bacterium]
MMASRKRGKALWIVLALVVLGAGGFFAMKAVGGKPAKIDPEKLAKVERLDVARSVVATGKIQPVTQIDIKSKASGIIEKLPVNVGDPVHKGDVICELDQNDLLPELKQQQAALHVAEANLRSAQADYARYQVDAQGTDLPFLKRDMDRAHTMFSNGLIAQNARDDADKNYQIAANRKESAEANLGSAKAAITRAQAALEQQQAAVAAAEENIRNATIYSPIDGVVLSRDSEVGTAVSSILQVGSTATTIMTVGDLSEVYVKGKVDESDVGHVYLGQPARIKVESFKDQTFTGKVTKISPMGVEKDNVTTFEVRVSISNDKHILKAQMSANAEIVLEEHKGVLAIPEGAVLYNKDRSTAVQIPDATDPTGMRKLAVKLGISNGAKTEVLSGLNEGQQVVLQ